MKDIATYGVFLIIMGAGLFLLYWSLDVPLSPEEFNRRIVSTVQSLPDYRTETDSSWKVAKLEEKEIGSLKKSNSKYLSPVGFEEFAERTKKTYSATADDAENLKKYERFFEFLRKHADHIEVFKSKKKIIIFVFRRQDYYFIHTDSIET
jgi:hypothetical protein